MPEITELQAKVNAPGIYFNISNEDYHNDFSISNSGMGNLLFTPKWGITMKTPQKYWWSSPFNPDREKLDTHALKVGRARHTLLLEPDKFHAEFKIKEGVQNSKAAGFIGEGAYKEAVQATNALRSSSFYKFFYGCKPEVSMFWVDEKTGVPCRIRMDAISPYHAFDLKTTNNVYDLGYSFVDYGYYRQAAFYLRGIEIVKQLLRDRKAVVQGLSDSIADQEWLEDFLKSVHKRFIFLFQESKAPFVARAEELDGKTMEFANLRIDETLQAFKENYEDSGHEKWASGFENDVGMTTFDELPTKISY